MTVDIQGEKNVHIHFVCGTLRESQSVVSFLSNIVDLEKFQLF